MWLRLPYFSFLVLKLQNQNPSYPHFRRKQPPQRNPLLRVLPLKLWSGLKRLIRLIVDSKVERLVLTHKDRLLRFGSELIFSLCEHFGTEVVIINRTEDSTFEEDLAQDVLEIITVFSARLYGSRSHKNRKIVEELRDVATRIQD